MRSVGLLLLFAGLAFVACVRQGSTSNVGNEKPQPTPSLSPSLVEVDLTINGARVGAKEADVIARLGKPRSVKNETDLDNCAGGYHRLLTYEGLTVDLLGDEKGRNKVITRMELTSPKWEIAPGVHIGDPISKVRETFGEPYREESGCLYYGIKDGDGFVNFYYKDGKLIRAVVSVTLC